MYFLIYSALAWTPKLVNGEPVTWVERSVPYYLNTDRMEDLSEADIEEAIRAASDVWSSSNFDTEESTFDFSYQGTTKGVGADFSDGEHVVSFDNSWTHDASLLAVTHVWSDSSGAITHFDIEINIDGVEWTITGEEGKHDLQNSMAHEFGHALGLEHSDDTEATMAATTSEGETTKRDLHSDDILGVANLYPYQEQDEPDNSISNDDGSENSSGGSSGGSVDNPVSGPSNSGSGSGPVALENSGCSTAPTSILWLGILALFQVRRRT